MDQELNTSCFSFWWKSKWSETAGKTESWNGTNWTEVNDLNLQELELAGTGASNQL